VTTIAELQDLQDNEQLHRLVQLIAEVLLTGKLESLGFTLATPVSSHSHQTNLILAPLQSPSSPRPRLDLVLSPEASPKRAKQGHVPKLWQTLQTKKCDSAPSNVLGWTSCCLRKKGKGCGCYVQAAGDWQTKL